MIDDDTRVKVADELTPRDYDLANANRRPGAMGIIVSHSFSHGLSFQVRHTDGSFGYYDEDELTQISVKFELALNPGLKQAIQSHGPTINESRSPPYVHEDLLVTPEMLIKGHRRKFVDRVQHYLNELLDDDNPSHCIGHIESECHDYTRVIKRAIANPMDEQQSQRRDFNDEFPWATSLSDEQRIALLNWIAVQAIKTDIRQGYEIELFAAFTRESK